MGPLMSLDRFSRDLGPVPERRISANQGLKFCFIFVFTLLFITYSNILCYYYCISE